MELCVEFERWCPCFDRQGKMLCLWVCVNNTWMLYLFIKSLES